MKRIETYSVKEWLGWEEEKPYAIVTVLHSGIFTTYGKISKEEIKSVVTKLKDLPVYLGHQVTPDDKVGIISEAWLEEADDNKYYAKARIDLDNLSNRFQEVKTLWKAGTCDAVSLQFIYTEIGAGELFDISNIKPSELSIVEKPVCKDCKISHAKFADTPRIAFLGTGPTWGYPRLGCECSVCKDAWEGTKSAREQSTIAVIYNEKTLLFDAPPTVSNTLQKQKFNSIDYVFISNSKLDRLGGLSDLRHYTEDRKRRELNVFVPSAIAEDITNSLDDKNMLVNAITDKQEVYNDNGLTVNAIAIIHGEQENYGWQLLYKDTKVFISTSFQKVSRENLAAIANSDYWIIDGSHNASTPTRASYLDQIQLAQDIGVKKIIVTHVGHISGRPNHQSVEDFLNNEYEGRVSLAYDGMVITLGETQKELSEEVEEVTDELSDFKPEDEFLRLQHVSNLESYEWEGEEKNRKLKIRGIALKPGVHNDVEYDWESIKNSAPSLIGQPITVDHGKSVDDVIGKVTKAWNDEKEQLVLFEGFIDQPTVAEKISGGLLDAISPEVKSTPLAKVFPLKVKDVIFTGISVVAKPACKGCRLTTKSINYLKKLQKYYEAGLEATKKAQESEKYIKDDRTNSLSTVKAENIEGGNTVTEDKKVLEKKVQSELIDEPDTENAAKTVSDLSAKTDKLKPVEKKLSAEEQEAEANKEAEVVDDKKDGKKEDEMSDKEDEKEANAAPEMVEIIKELSEDNSITLTTTKENAEALIKSDGWKPAVEIVDPNADVPDQSADSLPAKMDAEEKSGEDTKYSELEEAHKELLAQNIHKKELELGYQISNERMEELMATDRAVLAGIWKTIENVKPAKFGKGPKGESTAVTVPHSEDEKPAEDKEKPNPMLEVFNNL